MEIMEEKDLADQLIREGYVHLYVWEDGPNVEYPEHHHRAESAHIILNGEMTMVMNGVTKTYRKGDRCDLPAGIRHSVRTGPTGCRYLIGER
jgi:mannose-6-phosphate isomerase-like protein (cupin superfamily)